MNAYSKDLRLSVLGAVDCGLPREEVSRLFGVSLSTIKRWVKLSRQGEDLQPRHSTGRKRRILSTAEEKRALWKQLEENDEATLERHCELWEERPRRAGVFGHDEPGDTPEAGVDLQKRRWVPPSETKKREVLGGGATAA
jgi:transposase